MAKVIKFNLICDDKPIRNIEDLQENFCIEDVLKYYQNGLLLRWLDVRGYAEEYKKVTEIEETELLGVAKALIKIFGIEADEKKVEQDIYMIQFLDERKQLCELYRQSDFKVKNIIDDYRVGYQQLVDDIIKNSGDIAKIKADISEIMSNYKWAMDLNHRELFKSLYANHSVLAIMCLLMHEQAREYYLPVRRLSGFDLSKNINSIIKPTIIKPSNDIGTSRVAEEKYKEDNLNKEDKEDNLDKKDMYDKICLILQWTNFKDILGDNLKSFKGATDGYWKDLETNEKKYMVISMSSGAYVRSAGEKDGDLSSADVKNSFLVLDGIDFKSNYSKYELLYMEV